MAKQINADSPLKIKMDKQKESIKVLGAKENNLQNLDVEFPLGKFISVTGVSGSGKSSLINATLARSLKKTLL